MVTADTGATTSVGGAELDVPGVGLDDAAKHPYLDRSTVEQFTGAERFEVLRHVVEGIVGRRCDADEQPRREPLEKTQTANHHRCRYPLAPARQVGPGWQRDSVTCHG